MWPELASRRSVISASSAPNDSTEISRSWCRISTNRDMCVPLKLWGRFTYMLKFATVCWWPAERSFTRTGWLMSLMPTWLIGIWRVSARLCTSSTVTTLAFGATAEFIGRTVCVLSPGIQPLERGSWRKLRPRAAFGRLCTRRHGLERRDVLPESAHGRFEAGEVELGSLQRFL